MTQRDRIANQLAGLNRKKITKKSFFGVCLSRFFEFVATHSKQNNLPRGDRHPTQFAIGTQLKSRHSLPIVTKGQPLNL